MEFHHFFFSFSANEKILDVQEKKIQRKSYMFGKKFSTILFSLHFCNQY